MSAKLRFSYGTMNSGKSLQLLTTAYNFEQRGIKCFILKSSVDTRDGAEIKSRIGDGISRECMLVTPKTNIYELIKYLQSGADPAVNMSYVKWIFVDESQFLTTEQVNQLSDIVDYLNIDVWCFGLRTDFKTELFPGSKRLFEIADKLEEIKSSCDCGGKNTINVRLTADGKIITTGNQIEVGAEEKYKSICRKCYKKLKKKEDTH